MKSLKKLNKYFFRYKFKIILGIIFILFSNAAQVYIPILLKDSIDALKENISLDLIIKYAILIVAVAIVGGVFRFLIRTTIIIVSRKIEFDLRSDLWEHIQKLPTKFFQNNSTGNLMAHATNDISAVRMYIGPAVMYSIDTVSKFIIVIVIMISLNPMLTLYTLIPLPLLSYFVYKLSKKIHTRFTLIQEKFSELTTKAQESFSGIRVVKSYVREENEIKHFTKLSNDYLLRNMEKVKIQAWFMPMLFMITGISVIIVVWIGGSMVIEKTMTLGEIMAFVAYLGLLIWPVIAFGWVLNIIQQAEASMKRLMKIFSEKDDIYESSEINDSIAQIDGKIEFKNVSFKYGQNNNEVLKNISLEINKGETVAIIGHTGSGKTSLINLIPRLFDTTSGELLIDGNNVKEIPKEVLRKNIGLVAQETFLFSDTLLNNIGYGLEVIDNKVIENVAEISQLKKDLDSFKAGYETILGERGITLSGGQKQRTSLARALAINPKILILDDSFSAVDTNTEEEILTKLKEFMQNRTSIIISHRISTVKNADKIIVLENGVIAEQGTHDELVELNGIYADLFTKQLLEEELKEIE
ncbi:MAG: ABC transporter ATP-binding protein [Ignavibacteriales bacterium]|nr:ABC transporter ATP-binding protein [Ignavibacteriales bacterium]MCB9258139.1 ABC transporter ATP-binding protein [Ignavibacteriales bacterium]